MIKSIKKTIGGVDNVEKSGNLLIIIISVIVMLVFGSGRVLAYDFGEFDLGGTTVTLVTMEAASIEAIEELKETGRWEAAEEEFNVRLQTWDHGLGAVRHIEGLMTRFMAGDANNDIWPSRFNQLENPYTLAAKGVLYPVNEFLTEDYYDDYLLHGEIYGFGSNTELGLIGSKGISFYAYNTEIFERDGLPDLQELYDAGEWTWDNLKDIAIRATRDTTGDGEMDQLGISDSPGVHRQVDYKVASNSGQFARWIEGRVVATIDEDPVIETIEFFRDLHELGVISWGRDRSGFFEGRYAMFYGASWERPMINESMEADYRIVPIPMGPSAEEETHSLVSSTNFLPISSENPEAMVALYHYLFPADEMVDAAHDELMRGVRDRRSYEILVDVHFHGNLRFIAGEHNDLYGISQVPFHDALSGEKTAAVLTSELKPELQARLDDLFGQN